MRKCLVGIAVLGLLAGCSGQRNAGGGSDPVAAGAAPMPATTTRAPAIRLSAGIAALPDRGDLVAYDGGRTAAVVRGAYTWHPVELSEAHALRAVVGGDLVVTAPDGRPIRLRYERHVEHPDGNWTWIGREPGALPGTEAIITFGEKAVFGSIPNGTQPPLGLRTSAGRVWLVETDHAALAAMRAGWRGTHATDFLPAPRLSAAPTSSAGPAVAAPSSGTARSLATAGTTVDLLLGYTGGFASALGGQSQALTRLNYLVDVANQGLANSQVDARFRLVGTRQVSYTDATSNEDALYDLTGVECTDTGSGLDCEETGVPAALQPLHDAREQYGADLVSLVRDFNDPENDGCGVAWLNGGGLLGVSPSNEATGLSVVSDGTEPGPEPGTTYLCRDETLAHELGHNMGSAHDAATSDTNGNGIETDEKGAYGYSFGYKSASGNFFTIMAYGDSGQTPYRVFSNPAINSCGGNPCGIANAADNARSLRQTMPIVAEFRGTTFPERKSRSDLNGDGFSDLIWRYNQTTDTNVVTWTMLGAEPVSAMAFRLSVGYKAVAVGDFNGDGKADIAWRAGDADKILMWMGTGTSFTAKWVPGYGAGWTPIGAGDVDGDGKSDMLWRYNQTTDNNFRYWIMDGAKRIRTGAARLSVLYKPVATGDFNGDGKLDIAWRVGEDARILIWLGNGTSFTAKWVNGYGAGWRPIGAGDVDGDGKSDLLWRYNQTVDNNFRYWIMNGATRVRTGAARLSVGYTAVSTGDFDGNGKLDIVWRAKEADRLLMWSGNGTTFRADWIDGYGAGWSLVAPDK